MKNDKIVILTPVFNDWSSFQDLIRDIGTHCEDIGTRVTIVAVDDGSTETFSAIRLDLQEFHAIERIEIVRLARNTGHQRAIAIGLSYVEENYQPYRVIVMDADGEDSPSDIPRLLTEQGRTNTIVFARRGKRKENRPFRLFYFIYCLLFYILTGKKISFGNFCVIPGCFLRQVVFLPEIWSHFAVGILRSGLPQSTMLIDRSSRYHGTSKMNFVSLVMHGLSAFSVYTDILSVRMILFTFAIILAAIAGAIVLLYVRFFTDLAIPGWATTVGFGLAILLLQSLMVLLSIALNVLNSRSTQTYIPIKHFKDFLLKTHVIYG